MAIAAGTRLGPYEIVAPAGAGGMGEVYKARDTRLNRSVAIKILTEQWAEDPVMQQRFEREAKTIAALNHPNVCTLHDIGHEELADSEGAVDFLVMEYLEGETLADRLIRGALPLPEALTIAIAIADALDKAHKQGVIHRDLKPSNVMLTKRGPKLLDFGLAKAGAALESMSGASALGTMLPTAANVTTPGTILGTVQYMAPEQLEGKDADARTDIFAFGVLLYEMVAGRKPFQGKSKTLLMSAILTAQPQPLAHAQPMSPASLDHLVRRCLAKDPEERWQYAHDLLIQLRWIAGRASGTAGAATPTKRQRVLRLARAAAIVLAGLLAFPAALYLWKGDAEEFEFRSPVVGISPQDVAVSPDGRMIAFAAEAPAPRALYVRAVRSIDSRKIAGSEEASQPFWSPDSRTIGFVASGRLKTVDVEGGAPKDIAPVSDFSGGAWNETGTILFGTAKGVMRVPAEGGGAPQAATALEKGESGHFWPAFLPGGERFVYLAWTPQPGSRAVFSTALGSKERAKVMDAESNAVYAEPGYLLFHREASVFAQAVGSDGRPASDQPFHLADGILFDPSSGRGAFGASRTGTLIYFQGTAAGQQAGRGGTVANAQLGWVNRSNEIIAPAGDVGTYGDFDLSADGRLIAVTRLDQSASGSDIWVIDWQRAGVTTPITRDPGDDIRPVWSHDGRRIAYTSFRKGNGDIYVRNANGTGAETPLVESPAQEMIGGWSSDGRYLLYVSGVQTTSDDIYALPLTPEGTPDGKPLLVVSGPGEKAEPQLSFDGKWLAYVTTESGAPQVMVTSFPDGRERIPISKDGGGQPRWRRDGRELYYRLPSDNTVMVVQITPGATLTVGVPQVLFRPIVNAEQTRNPFRHQMNVDADGTRFLVRIPPQFTAGAAPPGLVAYSATAGAALPAQVLAGGSGRGLGQRSRGAGPPFAQFNGLTVVLNWTKKAGR